MSNYESFIKEYNVTDEQNNLFLRATEDSETYRKTPIFRKDPNDGALLIVYPNLEKTLYTYTTNNKTNPEKIIENKRLLEPAADGRKYQLPYGSQAVPFFCPNVLSAYEKKQKIETLYLVEGTKKAFKMFQCGLFAIGLNGINGYGNKDKNSEEWILNPDIRRVFDECKVKTVVLLFDADVLTINYEPEKDLFKRPNNFFNVVYNFRKAVDVLLIQQKATLQKCLFAHLHTSFARSEKNEKGIDDLIISNPADTDKIVSALEKTDFGKNKYFAFKNLTTFDFVELKQYFGVIDRENFYETYKQFIGLQYFNYKGGIYHFNGSKVVMKTHQDINKYMRVGCTYYKSVEIPNKHGVLEPQITKWKKDEITQDYKFFPNFIDLVPKYNGFCNIPDNTENYKRVHQGTYNMYEPLKHNIGRFEGNINSIRNTLDFLKHIFRGNGTHDLHLEGDPFTLGLDYLTIMYQQPLQKLPALCLVSPENGTGKTTFFKWLQALYGGNSTVVGNEQFAMGFNSHYITKFLIMIDEGFIEVDKKREKERLKKMITDDRQFLQFKGVDVGEIDFFGKILIGSNDDKRLMKIEQNEHRWFIVRVKQFEKENPDMLENMIKEIPAWLGFLKDRKVYHKRENRMWFRPELIITEQQRIIEHETRPYFEKYVDNFIRGIFDKVPLTVFRCDVPYIVEKINAYAKHKVEESDVREYLKDKKKLQPNSKVKRIKIPVYMEEIDGMMGYQIKYFEKVCRAFDFRIEDWFSESEISEMDFVSETGLVVQKHEQIEVQPAQTEFSFLPEF